MYFIYDEHWFKIVFFWARNLFDRTTNSEQLHQNRIGINKLFFCCLCVTWFGIFLRDRKQKLQVFLGDFRDIRGFRGSCLGLSDLPNHANWCFSMFGKVRPILSRQYEKTKPELYHLLPTPCHDLPFTLSKKRQFHGFQGLLKWQELLKTVILDSEPTKLLQLHQGTNATQIVGHFLFW